MLKLLNVLNCQAAAEMSCCRRDGQLTRWERITLSLHLVMCAGCRLMEKQFAIIDNAAKRLGIERSVGHNARADDNLSPEIRAKLKKLIH